jgi:cell division septation protein DedD
MTQTDGEKELVLGNKQLISLFFVVVALCGVFFAMGYLIGRNSIRAALGGSGGDAVPVAGASAQQQPQSEPPRETAAAPAQDSSPPVETRPAQDSTPDSLPPARPSAAPESDRVAIAKTESGASYLQVTALPRGDAESVVKTLREQSFPALLAESSKDGLYRVLVGPYHQTSQLADSKARLKTLGFANSFVQKQ